MMNSYLQKTSSERLQYRLLTENDIPQWTEFLSNPESVQFMPFDFSQAQLASKAWIEKQIKRYAQNRMGLMAIEHKETGKFIGQCGLLLQEIENSALLEIGYHIMPEFRGKGFASEASQHFKNIAKNSQQFNEVHSFIHIENTASQKVAQANGMKISKRTTYFGIEIDIWSCQNQ